jgi:hypothetical protein
MAARWKLVQSFIREATENEDYSPVADIATAYAKLRAIQRGAYQMGTAENGLIQITSKVGETEFSFAIPEGMGPVEIIETAETALELIQGKNVAQARALLQRRKTTIPDFSTFRLL